MLKTMPNMFSTYGPIRAYSNIHDIIQNDDIEAFEKWIENGYIRLNVTIILESCIEHSSLLFFNHVMEKYDPDFSEDDNRVCNRLVAYKIVRGDDENLDKMLDIVISDRRVINLAKTNSQSLILHEISERRKAKLKKYLNRNEKFCV